jgi:hypothetical protein
MNRQGQRDHQPKRANKIVPTLTLPAPTYPRGSEWRKWDLHIHSPLSILGNSYPTLPGGAPDWPRFVDRLQQSDLAVVGIADYFTIDGYKEVRRLQQQEGKLERVTVFPNIEFRLNKIVPRTSSGAEKRLTLHVLFSNEVDPRDIEEHFLHDIDFVFEGHPQEAGRTRKLKVDNLRDLGARLKVENPEFTAPELQVGAMTAVVDEREICDSLANDPRFAGKYLVVLADEHLSDIRWTGQGHVVRQTLLQRCDLVFSANPNTIQWCLGKEPYREGPDAFIREFKSLKPCIHGSDAHDFDRIGLACTRRGEAGHACNGAGADCNLRHCWVKADPTFEGLRQAVYEPEARVRIQADNPTPVRSGHSLSRFATPETRVNADLTIAAIDLSLNHGLVAVAGGKGSGKTALLDLIAHSFSDRRFVDNKNSFVKRIAGDSPVMTLSLNFADGSEFTKQVLDSAVCDTCEITYIAQGEMEDRIGDKEKLGNHIRELVLGSPQVKDSVRTFELREVESRAMAMKKSLDGLQERIQSLEDRTTASVEGQIQKSEQMLRTAVADTEAKVKAVEKRVGEERAQKAKATQSKLQDLESTRNTLLQLRDSVDEVLTFAAETLATTIQTINAINTALKALNFGTVLAVPLAYSSAEVTAVRDAIETRLKETLEAIEAASRELSTFEEAIRDHAGLLRIKAESEASLVALGSQRAELVKSREHLAELREQRRASFRKLLKETLDQRDILNDLFTTFAANKQQVLSDVVFTPEVSFDKTGLEDAVTTVVDGRQVRDVGDTLRDLNAAYCHLSRGETADPEGAITAVETLTTSLAGKLKATRALERATLYRVLWDNYLSVRPTIRYKGSPLDRLSLGQKATVLVKVYLAQGTTPIIIDSHDEHMDNEFIMYELVSALRQAKEYRQVIIASNNGNVVVNSDAEQVILANFSGGRIWYVSGSLEEPVIRDAALRVLEGGADAFRKRRVKYRVSM